MKKQIGAMLASLGLLLSLGSVAASAQAASLTSAQVQAILSLLSSFGADQTTINNVSVALGGSATSGGLSCSSFANLHYGDFDNNPGGPVSQLQTWLGIPSSTFGFGTYGRKTQAAWNAQCGGIQTNMATQPSNNTGGNSNTFATPTTGTVPLTVTFVAPPSAGGDYVYFGDGADGCSIPGVTNDGMTGCSVPSGMTFTHTYSKSGVYKAIVSRLLPSTILASATITVSDSGSGQTGGVSVIGMQKYTDNDFGFSVWLPNTWSMTKQTSANMLNSSGYQGGTLSAAWDFSGSVAGRIDEYTSPNMSVTILGNPLGYNYDYTLYFDTNAHTWMQTQNGVTSAADVSNNTMGGLHIISVFGEDIVPLSAHNFLIIHSEGRDYLDGIIKTILATDPSVAVPVDNGTQTQTVQAEYNNYVTAPAKCNNLGDVGAPTIENCRQNAVRGK